MGMTVYDDVKHLSRDERLEEFVVIAMKQPYCQSIGADAGETSPQAESVVLFKPSLKESMVAIVVPEDADHRRLQAGKPRNDKRGDVIPGVEHHLHSFRVQRSYGRIHLLKVVMGVGEYSY